MLETWPCGGNGPHSEALEWVPNSSPSRHPTGPCLPSSDWRTRTPPLPGSAPLPWLTPARPIGSATLPARVPVASVTIISPWLSSGRQRGQFEFRVPLLNSTARAPSYGSGFCEFLLFPSKGTITKCLGLTHAASVECHTRLPQANTAEIGRIYLKKSPCKQPYRNSCQCSSRWERR